jgi:hypothetical protein
MSDRPCAAGSDHARRSFEALARSVLSVDAGIEWIALEQAGSAPLWGWRDPSTGGVRTGVASADIAAADPLLLLVAEGGDAPGLGPARPHALRFVLLSYTDMTQIVARWGADAYIILAVGTAVDAHGLGKKLMPLLERSAKSADLPSNGTANGRARS